MAEATSQDVVNQALQLMGGNQPRVTGQWPNFTGAPGAGETAAIAANSLYGPAVATVMRQFGWDAARRTADLTVTGNVAPFPWAFEYIYPPEAIEIWQVMPQTLADPNDPLPINFSVANAVVAGKQTRVIHADLSPAQIVFNNNPGPASWDALLREAVARLLASEFAMALGGKPDTSQSLLQSGAAFETIGESRQD